MSAVSFSQEKKVKSEKADAVETTYSTPEVATKAETLEKRKFLMRESQKKKNTSEVNADQKLRMTAEINKDFDQKIEALKGESQGLSQDELQQKINKLEFARKARLKELSAKDDVKSEKTPVSKSKIKQ